MQVKCTSCGASQDISETQICNFCGNIIELESAKSNYQNALQSETGNLMAMAETAIEATNWEEALQYFNRVLEKNITNSDAWLGKGIAIVYTSKIGDLKINEAIAYWKNALKHVDMTDAMGKRIAKEIDTVVNSFYPTLENHFIQFSDLDDSYQELVSKFVILEKAQDYATQLDNSDIKLYETGYALCKRVIEIPKKHALIDETAAWVKGITGSIEQNKYKTADANKSRQKAVARKGEISKASKIVFELEEKYIENIIRINPDYSIVSSIKYKEEALKEKQKKEKESVRFLGSVFVGFCFLLIALKIGTSLNNSGIYFGEYVSLYKWTCFIIGCVFGWWLIRKIFPYKPLN